MLGALIGDIVGSVYEGAPIKTKNFEFIGEKSRFTDDSILTVASADAILHGYGYMAVYKYWARCYPRAGYGGNFFKWFMSDNEVQGTSFGNGSAMRVAPLGWSCGTLAKVLKEAEKSAVPSHNHPEAIKGAQAVASAVFLARKGKSKEEIKNYLEETFGYNLSRTLEEIRPGYSFKVSCQESVPEALTAFLESQSFEDALRCAVSLGGDSDTQACIAGAVAEAFYGPIDKRWSGLLTILMPQDAMKVIEDFNRKHMGSQYNFFCCVKESSEGTPPPEAPARDLKKLYPNSCRWWVRAPGKEEEVWAFAAPAEKNNGANVYFCLENGVIFDELCFRSFEDAFIALSRNGFDLHNENYLEGDNRSVEYIAEPPSGGFYVEPHPIFSSGRQWS